MTYLDNTGPFWVIKGVSNEGVIERRGPWIRVRLAGVLVKLWAPDIIANLKKRTKHFMVTTYLGPITATDSHLTLPVVHFKHHKLNSFNWCHAY